MKVPLLDLAAQHAPIERELMEAMARVLKSQQFILGPEVERLERSMAERLGVAHAFGVSSGTDALLLALMAAGVGPGDEVVTSTYSFFATGGAVARVGARPVFVDVEPATLNLDIRLLEKAVTPKTKAIIPVHLFGLTADMEAVNRIARARSLVVIEDAAQAIDVRLPQPEGALGAAAAPWAGTVGDFGCYSFFPSKNLGAFGDAGLVVTKDKDKAARLKAMRGHGAVVKYHHDMIGGNFRIDALQAAVLNVKLPHLDAWTGQRRANAKRYRERLTGRPFVARGDVVLPPDDARHSYNQFIVRVKRRDELKAHLTAQGIGNEVYYPVPFHLQKCFAALGYRRGDFPVAEAAAADSLAIPVAPGTMPEQIDFVVDTLATFYA